MKPLRYLRAAEKHLGRDPVLSRLIGLVGRCTLKAHADPFSALVRIVIGQQISTKAADAIENRVDCRFVRGGITPAAILRAPETDLRECGLSGAKVRTVRALAQRVRAREIE